MSFFYKYIKKYFKLLSNPDNFPIGKEVKEAKLIKRDNNEIFVKIFRKDKMEKYLKSVYLLDLLKNEEFVPKLINKDDRELKLELSYCGKQAMIKRLPINWKEQLIKIKERLVKKKISFIDWGPWDINPYVINNLCIKDDKIYFIDLGDCDFAEEKEITNYFDKKIYEIEMLLTNNKTYLVQHYLYGIYNMISRKLSRKHNWFYLLFLLYVYWYL